MPVTRLALAGAVTVAVLGLTGCGQEEAANDNTNRRSGNMPVTQPTIIRTPVKAPGELPTAVPLPGPTGGPQGEPEDAVEGEDSETSQQGPDGT